MYEFPETSKRFATMLAALAQELASIEAQAIAKA